MSHYKISMEQNIGVGHGKRKISIWRKEKTSRDHLNGTHRRNQENKDIRASWQNDGTKRAPFSSIAHTCNGKRNRYSGASAI